MWQMMPRSSPAAKLCVSPAANPGQVSTALHVLSHNSSTPRVGSALETVSWCILNVPPRSHRAYVLQQSSLKCISLSLHAFLHHPSCLEQGFSSAPVVWWVSQVWECGEQESPPQQQQRPWQTPKFLLRAECQPVPSRSLCLGSYDPR